MVYSITKLPLFISMNRGKKRLRSGNHVCLQISICTWVNKWCYRFIRFVIFLVSVYLIEKLKIIDEMPLSANLRALKQSLCARRRLISTQTLTSNGYYNFVDGRKKSPVDSNCVVEVRNPATGEVLCNPDVSGPKEVDLAVQSSKQSFSSWSIVC